MLRKCETLESARACDPTMSRLAVAGRAAPTDSLRTVHSSNDRSNGARPRGRIPPSPSRMSHDDTIPSQFPRRMACIRSDTRGWRPGGEAGAVLERRRTLASPSLFRSSARRPRVHPSPRGDGASANPSCQVVRQPPPFPPTAGMSRWHRSSVCPAACVLDPAPFSRGVACAISFE